MGEVIGENWRQPVQAPMDAGTYYEGELMKASSTVGQLQISTDKGDTIIAVVDEPTVDSRGDAVAVTAGKRIAVWRIGCGATVWVKSLTGVAYSAGDMVYADDTNGQCSKTATTSRPIGHFPHFGFKARTTASAGELIPVTLDVPIGTANV